VSNGARTAEDWAEAAAVAAQRSAHSARETANTALKLEHAFGRIERELRETRAQVTVGLTGVREEIAKLKSRESQPSLDFEDFEKTEGGGRRISPTNFAKLMQRHELHRDGHKWRQLWKRVRGVVWATIGAVAGAGAWELLRHFL